MIIKTGTILTLEFGAYSDFRYEGPFVVLRDFDQRTACDEFTKTLTENDRIWISGSEFTAWLATSGYIEDAPSGLRWDMGGYVFSPEITEDQ